MVTYFTKVLTGTFQLALLYMKVVGFILSIQNDTFCNIVVYHSCIIIEQLQTICYLLIHIQLNVCNKL